MRYLIVPLVIIFSPFIWAEDSVPYTCKKGYSAKLVALQGSVSFEASGESQWQAAHLDQALCEGSQIQVQNNSRVSLLLPSGVTLTLKEGTLFVIKVIKPDEPTTLNLIKGFIHFISRTPRKLEVITPIANAGPEGTEFAMSVDENKAALWVYEGAVKLANNQGSIHLSQGEGGQALAGQAPQAKIDIKPQDAVNWALYYPPVLAYPDASANIDSDLRLAIQTFRQGHIDRALSQMEKLPLSHQTLYYQQVKAAMHLTAGQDQIARQAIQTLLAKNPNDAEALALNAVLQLTQNHKDEAYALAKQAITANPQSASAYAALSYAEQSWFELTNAQAAADQAAKLAPHDALVWARKAELELSQGLTSASQKSAEQAIARDANLERTQTVLGFSYLLQMETDSALETFNKAIQFDSTSPLARLGLGLAKIRQGNLAEGRQDLETAAILDPNNSIVRSYLGKAYYEERRSPLADEQFRLAKDRDPKDPTPYFYDAINKQTTNRPVEALEDMQKAIEMNGNRAVYRSSLDLDKDAAARTANQARIYNDLGFGRLALKEAWKSLAYDSTNPTAHRFLSDAYLGQPRFRAARASELLQAQLLQPINITPVQPQLTGENIGVLNSTGPGSLSANEYDPLYNANGAHIVLNGAYGSNNTKTDNAIVSGVYNNFSGSLGQFHYETDGFRKNDDFQQNIYDVFGQFSVTPDLNLQIELKSEDIESGDVALRLNRFHRKLFRKNINQKTIRIGLHQKINNENDIIFSSFFTKIKDTTNLQSEPTFKASFFDFTPLGEFKTTDSFNTQEGSQNELQHKYNNENLTLTSGFGYLNLSGQGIIDKKLFSQDLITKEYLFCEGCDDTNFNISDLKSEYINGYIYTQSTFLNHLTATLGVSIDKYQDKVQKLDTTQINPKFGFIWSPLQNLTLRGAIFKTLKRPLAASQTIEPTQVSGFNQIYDSENGTTAWTKGAGVDYSLSKEVFFGGQLVFRETEFPLIDNENPIRLNRNESSHLAYFYWMPNEILAISTEYTFDHFRREHIFGAGDLTFPKSITSHQVPLSISYYHPMNFFGRITGTYVNQHITTVEDKGLSNVSEDFWTIDGLIGYRLPYKYGSISIEVRNVLDNKFNYESIYDASGPQLSKYIPERQFFLKLNLFY